MLLPPDDAYLKSKAFNYDVQSDQGLICVVIHDFPLPVGFDRSNTDLLVRLPQGFPDAQPDMFWCEPPIKIAATGAVPPAADQMEPFVGRTWQRFSRHLPPGAWKPGTDSLQSFLSLVSAELRRASGV